MCFGSTDTKQNQGPILGQLVPWVTVRARERVGVIGKNSLAPVLEQSDL